MARALPIKRESSTASGRTQGSPSTRHALTLSTSAIAPKVIMRTFVQLRRLMDSNRDLARKIEALEQKYDERFRAVFEAIKRLIAADRIGRGKAHREIGFHTVRRTVTGI